MASTGVREAVRKAYRRNTHGRKGFIITIRRERSNAGRSGIDFFGRRERIPQMLGSVTIRRKSRETLYHVRREDRGTSHAVIDHGVTKVAWCCIGAPNSVCGFAAAGFRSRGRLKLRVT